MRIYWWMLPFFLSANLHCFGMCGPLAAFLSQHRWRLLYFLGRMMSFALGGILSAFIGIAGSEIFHFLHMDVLWTLLMVLLFACLGFHEVGISPSLIPVHWQKLASRWSLWLAGFLENQKPWPAFIFGLATILLPCGQSMMVFSALALENDPWNGGLNGALFATMTSPALLLAMHTRRGLYRLGTLSRWTMAIICWGIGFWMLVRLFLNRA